MGLSFRVYLIAQDGVIRRLAQAKFDRMIREPATHRLPMFASQRVRMASVIVELVGGAPVRVARTTYAVVAFDREGRLDAKRFRRQQFALAESALAPALSTPKGDESIVEAASRFVAQGGRWTPSRALIRTIEDVAMDRVKCQRI